MDSPLTPTQFAEALDEWVGSEVAVRVVTGRNELLAVLRGRLGRRF